MAKPMPPDCATMPIRRRVATSGTWPGLTSTVGLNVAATFCTSLRKPSALGPETRMPLHRGAVAALLGKSRRDDHRVLDAGGDALLERAEHGARRNDDDGEIDRP